jgi:hypothetical protein
VSWLPLTVEALHRGRFAISQPGYLHVVLSTWKYIREEFVMILPVYLQNVLVHEVLREMCCNCMGVDHRMYLGK